MALRTSPLLDRGRVRVIERDHDTALVTPRRYRQFEREAQGREGRWLELLAWTAASLRALRAQGRSFPTELAQFVALYELKARHLGRRSLASDQSIDLRSASKAVWLANATTVAAVMS